MEIKLIDERVETVKLDSNLVERIIGFNKWIMDNYKKYHVKN